MINNDNFNFMAKFGSRKMISDFIRSDEYIPSYHTHKFNQNFYASPSIVDEVRQHHGRFDVSPHSHNLYDPSHEIERRVNGYHDISGYMRHPKHTDDDIIRMYDKFMKRGIRVINPDVGKKVVDHLISNQDHIALADVARFTENHEAHSALINHIKNEPVKMKADGLAVALAGNSALSKETQYKIADMASNSNAHINHQLVRNQNLDPDVALHVIKTTPSASFDFIIHKQNQKKKYAAAFDEVERQNVDLYEKTRSEFL